MKFTKKLKALAVALPMMLLSTVAAVTGTVAWFTANNLVNVSGMTVTTKVEGNLFIAENNSNDSNYVSDNLVQSRSGILEPVSTVNGVNWYYTKDKIAGNGAASGTTTFQTYSTNSEFASYYGIDNAVPFVDYEFYLKATSAAANQDVILSKINILYNSSDNETPNYTALGNGDKAWRVAVYSQTVAQSTNSTTDGSLVSILRRSGALCHNDDKAIKDLTGTPATFDTVSKIDANAVIGTLASIGTTQRYKVVVRLYLEGNDTTCTNETYVTLSKQYKLDLTCALADEHNTVVNALGSQA